MSFESVILNAGIVGQIIFQLRFIVLWFFSEKEGHVVIPLSFWYISIFGSSIVLCYAVAVRDPVFIAGQSAGFLIYLRNLYFIASERGMNKASFIKMSLLLLGINAYLVFALGFFAPAVDRGVADDGDMLFYYILGFGGQFFFFLRFLIQWLSSEKERKSVVPVSFWYYSLFGSALLFLYALLVQDIVFIIGQFICFFIYIRNLYFVHKEKASALA